MPFVSLLNMPWEIIDEALLYQSVMNDVEERQSGAADPKGRVPKKLGKKR